MLAPSHNPRILTVNTQQRSPHVQSRQGLQGRSNPSVPQGGQARSRTAAQTRRRRPPNVRRPEAAGGRIVVDVAKIEQAGTNNKAKSPEELVGKKVTVTLDAEAYAKRAEQLNRARQFFGMLKPGDSDSFDVKYTEGDELVFMRLTKDQAKRVAQAAK